MYDYEIETYSLRTGKSVSHGKWVEDDEIPDNHRSEQLWRHARPFGKPAVMWIQGPDDPDRIPLHIAGWGDDPETLAKMIASHADWR